MKRIIIWIPRVLTLLFAAFISVFAFDVFGEHYGFWKTILALLLHLIPTGIILIVLAASWWWEWVGAIVFPALGALYLVLAWGRFLPSVCLVMAGPLFLVGGLFLLSWLFRNQLRTKG